MNKRGGIFQIVGGASIIIGVIIVLFIFVLMGAMFLQGFGTITSSLTDIQSSDPNYNISNAASVTFGNINEGIQQLRWISVVLIIGAFIGIFFSYFLVKAHPAWFIFYIILCIGLVIFSIYISSSYETMYNSGSSLGESLKSFTGASYIILYLPIIVSVISVLGAIFLFTSIGQNKEEGGII